MQDGKQGKREVQGKDTEVSGAVSSARTAGGLPMDGRITFCRAVSLIAAQIGLDGFKSLDGEKGANWRLAWELCKIAAEVIAMQDDTQIRISGETVDARLVKEVFAELRTEHVAWVIESIRIRGAGNAQRKFYVRSMLYNAVFEMETYEQSGVERGLVE